MLLAFLGLFQYSCCVLCTETAADGTGLLGPEVEGQILLPLVEDAELRALLGVDDCEHSSDRLAEVVAGEEGFTLASFRPDSCPVPISQAFDGVCIHVGHDLSGPCPDSVDIDPTMFVKASGHVHLVQLGA